MERLVFAVESQRARFEAGAEFLYVTWVHFNLRPFIHFSRNFFPKVRTSAYVTLRTHLAHDSVNKCVLAELISTALIPISPSNTTPSQFYTPPILRASPYNLHFNPLKRKRICFI
jgi:hypothetical protein